MSFSFPWSRGPAHNNQVNGARAMGRRNRVGRDRRRCRRSSLESLEPRVVLSADLMLAEVMVSNDETVKDEDGTTPDWLEIYNAGSETADLTGWHLTDRLNDRTQWTFSGGTLSPGESLLVFASGKDRRDPNGELHTNFRLSEGEYLGLYQPDGRTVADEYQVLPGQFTDISYGIGQTLEPRTFIDAGAAARVLTPSSAAQDVPSASWTSLDFDDASWAAMTTGLGFDLDILDGDFNPLIDAAGDLTAMRGQTASAYVRQTFDLPGDTLSTYRDLDLSLNYDDGFVAYLNGTVVAQANAPGTLAWDSRATATHGGIADVKTYFDFSNADDRDDYTLLGDASFQGDRLRLTESQTNQTGAAWVTQPVKFGSDYTFRATVTYDIHSPGGIFADNDGLGGEGVTFVLQGTDNNLIGSGGGALGLDNAGATFLSIELDSNATGSWDPDDSLPSHLGITTSDGGSVARVAIDRFNGNGFFPGIPGPGENLLYLWVEYQGETQQLDVFFSDDGLRPAEPTLSATVNLQDIFGGVPELFAGFTSATSDAYNTHDVVGWTMTTGVGELGRDSEVFDLSDRVDLLRPGRNVLAIHALNVDPADEDFLLLPQLTAEEVVLGDVGYFLEPTPGELNGPSGLAPAGAVSISQETQIFVQPFQVELTGPSPQATVHYTTDGSLPDESSPVYTGPITVNGPMRLRARAIEPGRAVGPVTSAGYIQLDNSLASFENGQVFDSNLPLMVFDSYGQNVHRQTTRLVPTMGVFIDPGDDGRASLLDDPDFAGRSGLRIRGQSSEGWAKKQYAVELWDQETADTRPIYARDVKDKDVSFFGLPAGSDWVLNGPYSDKTQLNNYLTFNWYRDLGLYAPRARLVEVFVNMGDDKLDLSEDYRGTYVLLEKIKIGDDRVDIVSLQPGDVQEPEITGGYIWKKDKAGANDRPFRTSRGQELRLVEPSDIPRGEDLQPGYVAPEQKEWLKNYIDEFEEALYGPNFADPKEGYAKYIDIPSWADTWLMVELTKNIDGFRLSTYYHKDRGGKIKQGPAWDYNLSLGNGNYLKGAYPEGWYKDGLDSNTYPYWDRLFEDPNFEQAVADRWQELRRTILTKEKVMADIDAAVALLSDGNPNLEKPAAGEPSNPIARNFDRWSSGSYGTGIYHWPNCFFGQGDCPRSPLPPANTPNGRPNSYDDYIYIMKWFLDERLEWMDSQFVPPVALDPDPGTVDRGTQVTMTAPANYEIFFTTDGSDPRQPLIIEEESVILGANATAQVYVPTNGNLIGHCDDGIRLSDKDACFINPTYQLGRNGETWTDVTLPIGYDVDDQYDALLSTDIEGLMKDVNSSVYVRIPFTVDADTIAQAESMTLSTRYDDGFVVYMWLSSLGTPVEVARVNAAGIAKTLPINALAYNEAASQTHPDELAVNFEDVDLSKGLTYVKPGQNYLVLQVLNESASSPDFLFDAELRIGTSRVEVSPSVQKYEGPITIDSNTQIVARGFDSRRDEWTGVAKGIYVVDAPSVAITEINYNPSDPTAAELVRNSQLDNDDFEFIEVQNVGASESSLVGVHFDGIEFTFGDESLAPGEYGVVVKNRAAFELRYGTEPRVLGEFFGGSLNNNGERLELFDAANQPLLDFSYDDSELWPQRADGVGGTLELIDPAFTSPDLYGKYYSWRGSTEFGGSPGSAGEGPLGIVVNEVLAHTDPPVTLSDSIELMNISNEPINLGGWFLSDAAQTRNKYRIPDGTIVPPGEFVVFDESHFNTDPDDETSFALSGTDGDDVWLTKADALGNTVAFVDDVTFRPSLNGESFGRVPDGTGRLAPMQSVTLGAANSLPRVGPVVITELNYAPSMPTEADLAIEPNLTSGDLEYIEIHNPTAADVDLTDWRIRGGVDFNFAPGDSLPAGRTLLLLPFNPAVEENASRLAAFRSHYNVSLNTALFGGYGGGLGSEGERVTLLRADLSQIGVPAPLPRVIEDEVVYDNRRPWPTDVQAAGTTLQRRDVSAYGNSAQSWVAATPNPGDFAPILVGNPDFDGDGRVDVADVDLLLSEIRKPSPSVRFDLTGDGLVNVGDRDRMILSVLGTSYGDSNLDGIFNSTDLINVFQVGEYEDGVPLNSTWADGDWDGDGDFTTRDMILAFQQGDYVAAAQSAGESSPAESLVTAELASAIAASASTARPLSEEAGSRAQSVHRTSEPLAPRAVDVLLGESSERFADDDDTSLFGDHQGLEDLLDVLDEIA